MNKKERINNAIKVWVNKNQDRIQFDYVYENEEDYGIRIIFIEKKTLKINKETWLNRRTKYREGSHLPFRIICKQTFFD